MNFSDIARKKVAGIPVLYLAAVAVLVLAIYAWRMKPSADFTGNEGDVQGAADAASGAPIEAEDPYAGLATNGTVTVVQGNTPANETPTVDKSNEAWITAGAEWAVTNASGLGTTGVAAAAALNKYVNGVNLTADELKIVNAVIKEKGQPPEGIMPAEEVKETNSQWQTKGAAWAGSSESKLGVSILTAQSALSHYLGGEDLSYAEGQIVNAVIGKYGQPPEGVGAIGQISTTAPVTPDAPAQKQFSNYPGKHTVKGSNDNTMLKLSQLYYASSYDRNVDLIASENLGINKNSAIPKGTVINIPYLHTPKFFTVTSSTTTESSIAAKNGISVNKLRALNPNVSYPAKVGNLVRVA